MIGTWIIAVAGYGTALWLTLGFAVMLIAWCVETATPGKSATLARELQITLSGAAALLCAAVTRWLLGGAP